MIPEEIIKDLESLKDNGHSYEIVEETGKIYIKFKDHPLPPGIYNMEKTDLLIFTTPMYPNAGFDMFWVNEKLLLKTNSVPRNAEVIEKHLGENWRRFSYHPYQSKPWNPAEDNVNRFMSYVNQRLKNGD